MILELHSFEVGCDVFECNRIVSVTTTDRHLIGEKVIEVGWKLHHFDVAGGRYTGITCPMCSTRGAIPTWERIVHDYVRLKHDHTG
jgi:hypothetical protein